MKRLILILLLCASTAIAGGLYDEETATVSGTTVKYIRTPRVEIQNPLGGIPSLEFVIEKAKVGADGDTTTTFVRRNTVSALPYEGKKIPQIDPVTGLQDGTFKNDNFYKMVYSLMILSEEERKGRVGFVPNSSPVIICYTTSSNEGCTLP